MALVVLLSGCAANQLHGYQNTYQGYAIPQPLLQSIEAKFRQHGLAGARITRDLVGRVQLAGTYRNEDEVDTAFVIVQSIVGLKSTSPFYPTEIRERRAEREARAGLSAALSSAVNNAPPRRIALVIGINEFRDPKISPVPGEDDAIVAARAAKGAGYVVTSLLGKAATKVAIESTLHRIEEDLRPQDSLFVYISSHGAAPLPTSRGGDQRRMSIVAWDTSASHGVDGTDGQVQLQKTSVSDALVQRLAMRPTRNTRILIDTCYSGDMLRGFPDPSGGYIRRANGGAAERAGISMAAWTGPEYTTKGIRFVNDKPAPRNGARQAQASVEAPPTDRAYTIITATSADEKSLAPGGDNVFSLNERVLKGSFFTQAFFAFLEQHQGHVEPAFAAAREFTSAKAREVSRNTLTQVPLHFATQTADRNAF
ncbi:caspase family protein [Massilia sp. X63]|uniref:caspase family protein n=1 Tax=Massilia sp. X63 TaxID=3237285 RepID=UPI0034DCFEC0